MRAAAALLLAALVGCHHAPTATTSPPPAPELQISNTDPLGAKIDAIATRAVASGATVGVSVAVGHRGKIDWARGYGYANIVEQAKADANTVYRIGSLTKQFTAAAIVQLAEAGKLALTDPATKYVPDMPTGGNTTAITLEQLLHHTSGLPSYTDQEGFDKIVGKHQTPGEILALVKDVKWSFAPGTKYEYSNTGYVVLGMVIEKVSGESYATYLARHVFPAAGLTATSYCDESKPDGHRAQGYAPHGDDGKPVNADVIDMSVPFSAGAICSTVIDLVRWSTALAAGRVVSLAGYKAMTTSHGIAGEQPYGFGLEIGELKGHKTVFHNGGINGFVSELHTYPDDGVVIAVLTNTETAASKDVEHGIAVAELAIPSEVVAISAAELAAFPGTYDVPMLGDVVIAVDGDHLTIHPAKQATFTLEYHGKDVFVLAAVEATITFERDAATKAVTGLVIKQGTHDVEGKRKEP